jgi:hypothetical protein
MKQHKFYIVKKQIKIWNQKKPIEFWEYFNKENYSDTKTFDSLIPPLPFKKVEKGNFATIKSCFTNLYDWSVESSYEIKGFRINYLKSNNLKDTVELDYIPDGFTHILRFYKR